jgi:antitoxin ParD1/3/4
MPTRNISLTREQDDFVEEIVEAGEYQNASEAVRDALRALQQRRKQDELKLELLRAHVELGVSALDRGDATEIDVGEIENYLANLGAPRGRRSRRKRTR